MNDTGPTVTSFPAVPGAFSSADALENYWREIRGARRLPARTSIDPARIDAALPHAFIIERVASGIARFRVCGQAINALVGSEARGMPLTVLFSVEGRAQLAAEIDKVFDEPALMSLPIAAVRGLARPRLAGRLLLMPLQSPDGTVNRALGALFVDGMIGQTPRVFDFAKLGERRVESLSYQAPETTRPAQTRPALRLVVNNG